VATVAAVHLLDHLLAPVGVEVDVDIRLFISSGREETFEGQLERNGVDRGDPEHVANNRIGRRPPALAENPFVTRELHHAVHDQEVAGEVLVLDHCQLFTQPLLSLLADVRIALVCTLAGQFT